MKFDSRGYLRNASLLLLLGYFLTYVLYHLANYVFYNSEALSIIWVFVQKATYLLLPILASLAVLIVYTYKGMKAACLTLIPLSLVRMIYFIPYYYLVFIYDFFDSLESILLALIASLAESVIAYALTLLVFLIMKTVISRKLGKHESFDKAIAKETALDFGNPVSLAFMIVSALSFLYFFIMEIIDTVGLIIDYSSRFTAIDIIYIVASFVFDALLLLLHYFTLSFLKNYIVKKRVTLD